MVGRASTNPRSSRRLGCIAGFGLLFVALLSYGYWHVTTHGSVHISVYTNSSEGGLRSLHVDEVTLLGPSGEVLARGRSEPRTRVVYLEHPRVGSCLEAEQTATTSQSGRNAWQTCFETHSRWVVTWARDVRAAKLSFDDCAVTAPVEIRESSDEWWLWWLPHPHLGGKPYTYFSLVLSVGSEACDVDVARR